METVYAGGIISGNSYEEVTSWRDYLKHELFGIAEVLLPMRGKNFLIG